MSVRSLVRSGLISFSETRSMLVGNETFRETDFELIETVVLTDTQASIVFSNLGNYSSTYKHLQIRGVGRTNRADTDDELRIRINGDVGSNYSSHDLFASGTSLVSQGRTSQTSMFMGRLAASNINSNIFGPNIVDILDAYSTTKNTTLRAFSGTNRPTNSLVNLNSGTWYNTASVTSITLINLASFVSGTRFSIYGIRG
jgi:hypothetical protein